MKLALGTVQFGLNYGVTNTSGQVPAEEVGRILKLAQEAGIDTLDTAIGYGESEARLGQAGVKSWKAVSKLPGVPADCASIDAWVTSSVNGSLQRLGLSKLYGLLLHQASDLSGPHGPALHAALLRLIESQKATKIGVSIYNPEELAAILPRYPIQLLQAPYNVFDRRLETSGWLDRLKAQGIEVHTRSTFLQGLLLLAPKQRPKKFQAWDGLWSRWQAWIEDNALTPLQATLGFACRNPALDRVLVGVNSTQHLRDIIEALNSSAPPIPAAISTEDERLLDPSRWNDL